MWSTYPDVELELLLPRNGVAAVALCPARDARTYLRAGAPAPPSKAADTAPTADAAR